MPFFVRTRRLDIRRLEKKPQEDLSVVHAILTGSVKEVLEKLIQLERAFYAPGKNAVDEMKKWAGSVKSIMESTLLSHMTSAHVIDDVIKMAADPQAKFRLDMFDLNRLKECYRKVKDAVPDKFSDIILDIRTILKYQQKYCLTFYDPDCGIPLETAVHYTKQRQQFIGAVKNSVAAIQRTGQTFRRASIWPSDLSPYGLEVARKGDCSTATFLVLFPECCEKVRLACSTLTAWLEADASYEEYLSHDITDLDQEKTGLVRETRECQQQYHQLLFRKKQVETEQEALQKELEDLKDREYDLLDEESSLTSDTNEVQLEIEIKEHRRDELIRNASKIHPSILIDRYNELSEDLRERRCRLPFMQRQLKNVRYKIGWMGEKKEELKSLTNRMNNVAKDVEQTNQHRLENELQLEHVCKLLALARHIRLYKTSPDAVHKIYHDQPVEVNHARLPGHKGKDDPFERACDVVAAAIEGDWPTLYRQLPFHPARGSKTIDKDIAELSSMASRTSLQEICELSLKKWRRFHTRAKYEDLQDALAAIGHRDVLTKLDLELNPPEPVVEVQEEPPAFLEKYLIPYYREVEKYDALKAANKSYGLCEGYDF